MAVAYDISQSQNRKRVSVTNDLLRTSKSPPSTVSLHKGDLAYENGSNEPVPGSELGATFGTLAAAQEDAHDKFLGVVGDDYEQGENTGTATVERCEGQNGFLYPLAAEVSNIVNGDLLGVHAVDLGGGNFQITDNTIVKVATANLAIGRATRVTAGEAIDQVIIVPVSTVLHGGVQAPA